MHTHHSPSRPLAPWWLIVLLTPLLGGCSWFGWSDDQNSPAPRPAGSAEARSENAYMDSITLADRRLERIYNKQIEVMANFEARPGDFTEAERDRLLNNLLSQYQSFTLENPNFVYGYILYGKLLRQVGDREAANIAFAKANQLDPQIAVVKQQLGNYLAEEGEWETALRFFASAVELEPDNALYHYQIGELLYQNRDRLLTVNGMPKSVFDTEMLNAFAEAARLDPDNRNFQMRYAEAFFDVENPDWPTALALWNYLEPSASNPLERDIIRIQKARILIIQGRTNEAKSILIVIDEPSLESARQDLMSQL